MGCSAKNNVKLTAINETQLKDRQTKRSTHEASKGIYAWCGQIFYYFPAVFCPYASNGTTPGTCDEHSICEESKTDNPFDFTCRCSEGYEGHGKISLEGEGCTDYDVCKDRNIEHPCGAGSMCKDDEPPSLNYTCQCL